MFNIYKQEVMWGGRPLTLETGRIARQANGAVLATYGDTTVLCTVVAAHTANVDGDFLPLTVVYQEKSYAAGKIPGGFLKREGRPSDKATLTSRLIDRPIRPLFPSHFRNETQVICTVLSYDQKNDPDIVALIGASAALTISGIPFYGPIGGARVGYKDGNFLLNPTKADMVGSQLDLVVAGTKNSILMIESEAHELSEDLMLEAILFGQKEFQPVIDAIIDLAEDAAKEPWELAEVSPEFLNIQNDLQEKYGQEIAAHYQERSKQLRHEKLAHLKNIVVEAYQSETVSAVAVTNLFKGIEKDIVRKSLLETKQRIDGRNPKEIRPIECDTGILPGVHGSALFTRGETQALVVTTLGAGQDEQIIDALEGEYKDRFMLHYNFPPFATGEAKRLGSPGRREIGHGKLAWRALNPLLPIREEFPYTTRVVSDITESNGSSSMATVCGACLSMMDAGVPLKRHVAGIAMGLIKEEDSYVILSDILGDEDHLGDMDFKVAGTEQGITSLQLDNKLHGISETIMRDAIHQAVEGIHHILKIMQKAMPEARADVRETAPKISTIQIPRDKIGEVIGPGGKVVREISETLNVKVDIDDEGIVRVSGAGVEGVEKAIERIQGIACDPEIGEIYNGKVVKIMPFGAFVNFRGNRDGLVHISEICEKRLEKVEDALSEGDHVKVKFIGFDNRGKLKLSIKQAHESHKEGDEEAGA